MTRGCPFLAAAAARTAEPGSGSAAALFDSATSLDEALHVVHGPHGPLPLPSSAPEVASSWPPTSCPFLAAQARRAQACEADGEECSAPAQECAPEPGRGWSASAAEKEALRRLAAAPFARIAFPSGFGTTPLTPPSGDTPGQSNHKAVPPAQAPAAQSSAGASGSCPMRRVPGFERVLKLCLEFDPAALTRCPPAVVAARAAVARLPAIRALRPQPLPARFAAVAAFTAAVNAPCGAARVHTRKFSGPWFGAVHASIPLIVMLRKALVMPPYAVLVTITAAVLGQTAGSRGELARLAGLEAATGGGEAPQRPGGASAPQGDQQRRAKRRRQDQGVGRSAEKRASLAGFAGVPAAAISALVPGVPVPCGLGGGVGAVGH